MQNNVAYFFYYIKFQLKLGAGNQQ